MSRHLTQVLTGHTNSDTAYLVPDYPYGRKVRCRIRYWLEYSPTKGYRFVSQTENPSTLRWNAPKKGTYVQIAACLYLDENSHVQCATLTGSSNHTEVAAYLRDFPQVAASQKDILAFLLAQINYNKKRADGDIYFTINGVLQEMSAAERERSRTEESNWKAVFQQWTDLTNNL